MVLELKPKESINSACNDRKLYAKPIEPDTSAEGKPMSARLIK
jgi:hypothetical protein